MRLTIAAVGRLKDGPERALFQRYADRIGPLGRASRIGPLAIIEIRESRETSPAARMSAEATSLMDKVGRDAVAIALDERGRSRTSEEFAKLLERQRADGTRDLAFLIGGADGHGPRIRDWADRTLSLSPMTLPHGLARLVLVEQVYRALTILAGHPYHRSG